MALHYSLRSQDGLMPRVPLFLLPLLGLCACLGASTEILADSGQDEGAGGGGAGDGGAGDGGAGDGGAGDGGSTVDPLRSDDDGDGFSEEEGDCDDTRAGVYPGALDGCDGLDNDCDDELDEDGTELDPTEPNDSAAWTLGELADGERIQQLAGLHNDEDVDRFRFSFEDSSWSIFTLAVSVTNIPSSARYRVSLTHLDRGEVYLDEAGNGTLSVEVGDTLLQDDGGTWELVVQSETGADCGSQYLVTVEL